MNYRFKNNMIYPDQLPSFPPCPICGGIIYNNKFSICSSYCCRQSVAIDGRRLPHYEFIRYNNGQIYCQYTIEPFHIVSHLGETEFFHLKPAYSSYYTKEKIAVRKGEMYLTDMDKETIFNKIKILTIFS